MELKIISSFYQNYNVIDIAYTLDTKLGFNEFMI